MAAQKEMRIAAIGFGARGSLIRHAHNPEEGSRVVAGCDTRPEALQKFQELFGEETFVCEDYHELLRRDDIDAVFVLTPDYLHAEHASAALRAGKHVYLEKPMAITIEGCDRILQSAVEGGARLYLGHNMRHMDVIRKMKELIDSGRIGEVRAAWCRHFVAYGGDAYYKDWHAEQRYANSLLLQKGAHDIDVLHWLCGGYSKRVSAMGNLTVYNQVADRRDEDEPADVNWYLENWPPLSQKKLNPVIDVEDLSMMLMELDNGVLASYQQCHYTPDSWRDYTIIGTEGRVENLGDTPGNCAVHLWNRRTKYQPAGDEVFEIPAVEGGHGGADPRIVGEFLRFCREGGEISTSPVAARYAVAAGCCAARSLRNRAQSVEVPPLEGDLRSRFE
jgi:predicted dehydrogenase